MVISEISPDFLLKSFSLRIIRGEECRTETGEALTHHLAVLNQGLFSVPLMEEATFES